MDLSISLGVFTPIEEKNAAVEILLEQRSINSFSLIKTLIPFLEKNSLFSDKTFNSVSIVGTISFTLFWRLFFNKDSIKELLETFESYNALPINCALQAAIHDRPQKQLLHCRTCLFPLRLL